MGTNKQAVLWLSAAAGAALALLLGRGEGDTSWLEGVAGPGRRLGEWLRELSLSGAGGDLAAWALVLAVCALPLLFLCWRRYRQGRFQAEDMLLPLMSLQLFVLLYFLVNPALLKGEFMELFPEMRDFFSLAILGTLCSTGVAWLVLKALRGLENCPTQRLPAVLCPLLVGGAALMALAAGFGGAAGFVQGGEHVLLSGLLTLMRAAPTLLGALVLLWGEALARKMGEALFSEETARLCARTALGCRIAVQASVVLSLAANLLQLVLYPLLYAGQFSVEIPLFSLTLSAALYLLCRSMERGQELQADSDSII